MKQLINSGILVPKYAAKGFSIRFKWEAIKLAPAAGAKWVRTAGNLSQLGRLSLWVIS